MPFPVELKYINTAERRLGLIFPDSFKAAMAANNGGTVLSEGDT
jgi:hypothetical protein